ncbi:MAG TPA: outer membrane beta-barrel protein [Bdellovibrionales bacterium]|nr:outer membrane beta-barrel protein [Bdellovibrionales bacterium]
MKYILALLCGLAVSSSAFAQNYGGLLGFHQTDADIDGTAAGASIDGKLNFKAGLAVSFELMPMGFFRTGALYNQRAFEVKTAGGNYDYKFAYLDIPANFQYGFNEMFALYGGLTVAVNIADDVSEPAGAAAIDPDADTMIPLLDLGVNLTFDDMVGFDFYYQRGLGGFAEDLENYNSFGANFIYWF